MDHISKEEKKRTHRHQLPWLVRAECPLQWSLRHARMTRKCQAVLDPLLLKEQRQAMCLCDRWWNLVCPRKWFKDKHETDTNVMKCKNTTLHTHTHTHTHTHAHSLTHSPTHSLTHALTHSHLLTHRYTHTHTHTQFRQSRSSTHVMKGVGHHTHQHPPRLCKDCAYYAVPHLNLRLHLRSRGDGLLPESPYALRLHHHHLPQAISRVLPHLPLQHFVERLLALLSALPWVVEASSSCLLLHDRPGWLKACLHGLRVATQCATQPTGLTTWPSRNDRVKLVLSLEAHARERERDCDCLSHLPAMPRGEVSPRKEVRVLMETDTGTSPPKPQKERRRVCVRVVGSHRSTAACSCNLNPTQ